MMLNPAEQALSRTPPTFQPPVSPAVANQTKELSGMGAVPNSLLGSLGGAVAAGMAGPFAPVLGGVAEALAAPMPSLTATVNSDPSVKYGDRYVENLVGASKAGQFVVTSGSSNPNAENRAAASTAQGITPKNDMGTFSVPTWVWIGLAAIAGVFAWVHR